MNHLERLKRVTAQAQQEDDLPDLLAERILALIPLLLEQNDLCDEINDLCDQIAQYDTFGQTGYCGMGVDNHILECRVKHIEALIKKA